MITILLDDFQGNLMNVLSFETHATLVDLFILTHCLPGRKPHTAWHPQSLSHLLLFSILVMSGDFMRLHAHVFPFLDTHGHTHTQYRRTQKLRTAPWQYSSECPFRRESLATPALETYFGKNWPVHYRHHIYIRIHIQVMMSRVRIYTLTSPECRPIHTDKQSRDYVSCIFSLGCA